MPFGTDYTKSELLARVGRIEQLASATLFEFTDGPERGMRGLLLENAAGLRLTVLPDRCLDIGAALYKGIPLAWLSPNGFPHPAHYDPQGTGFLRSFGGGLVATCGLTNVGPPTDDEYGHTGLHGRIGNTPASNVSSAGRWDGESYSLSVTGALRETRIFGENLLLSRTLTLPADEPRVIIRDEITNKGDTPAPLMLLYHCNFGFPLLSADARIEGSFASVTPRDEDAAEGRENALAFDSPTPGYKEKVYWLDPISDAQGYVSVSLVNELLGLRATLRYNKAQLPCLTEWKQMGQGTYVVGIEPGNVHPLSRKHYLEHGTLPMLDPGERREFGLEISVTQG